MRFSAIIKRGNKKIFDEMGDREIEEILAALDNAVEKETKRKK